MSQTPKTIHRSVTAAEVFVSGNLKSGDALRLTRNLEQSLRGVGLDIRARALEQPARGTMQAGAPAPSIRELVYRPSWQPATAQDVCAVSGVASFLDTCGPIA